MWWSSLNGYSLSQPNTFKYSLNIEWSVWWIIGSFRIKNWQLLRVWCFNLQELSHSVMIGRAVVYPWYWIFVANQDAKEARHFIAPAVAVAIIVFTEQIQSQTTLFCSVDRHRRRCLCFHFFMQTMTAANGMRCRHLTSSDASIYKG